MVLVFYQCILHRMNGILLYCYHPPKNHQDLLLSLQLVRKLLYEFSTTSYCYTGGDPVQLNYSDDDNVGCDEFVDVGPVPEHDEFSVMNDQTGVFADNFTAANTYKCVVL